MTEDCIAESFEAPWASGRAAIFSFVSEPDGSVTPQLSAEVARDALWYWIRERERVRVLRRDGGSPPWTSDPIVAGYRFCNVRREDDKVTRWIDQHVRGPYAGHPMLWLMLCLCRQVCWPDTLAELINGGGWPDDDGGGEPADEAWMDRAVSIMNARRDRGDKVYTGAYMISAPPRRGACKQDYVVRQVVGGLWRWRSQFRDWSTATLESTSHKIRTLATGWGPFMAYQAVVDMRFTPLLSGAVDVRTWCAAGPGTLRGLNRVHGRPVSAPLSQGRALDEIVALYAVVERETSVAVDLSDVPNVLCETDKYLRTALGQGRPRARYVAGRG